MKHLTKKDVLFIATLLQMTYLDRQKKKTIKLSNIWDDN